MPITFFNNWRIEVLEAVHTWPNRYVVTGATSGGGTFDPVPGAIHFVDGADWVLDAQHQPPGEDWTPSLMQQDIVLGQEHVNLHLIVGAEDPLPTQDFRDIRLSCIFLGGQMIEIPYRPYAIRTGDLMQMPDGVFEARLGTYFMAVRVHNRWGQPFTSSNVIDITPQSRAELAMHGIVVSDDWSGEELDALGQQRLPLGMVVGPLRPGDARTVFFKLDVSAARTGKYNVEFVLRNVDGMADPDHVGRRASRQIFVSRIDYDAVENTYVFDAPQGTMRVHFDRVAIDLPAMRRALRKARAEHKAAPGTTDHETLRHLLDRLLSGDRIDLCEIQRLLACHCLPDDDRDKQRGLDPFYLIPTGMRIRIDPKAPWAGQFGEIPYDDPWWKVPIAIIAAILALLGALEEGAQAAYEDEDLVIGKLFDFERHQLDAALCKLDTSRELRFLEVLDAQSDEDNLETVLEDNLDGVVTLVDDVMTRQEIEMLMVEARDTGNFDLLKVFKSGARTGTTIAEIDDWSGPWRRCDLSPEAECDPEDPSQFTRFDDEDRPTLRFVALGSAETDDDSDTPVDPADLISNRGDSGSVWAHFDSKRPIALNHSGNPDRNTATGSLLADIAERFGITFS